MDGKPALWLDYYDYGANLLTRGDVPWLDQSAFGAFHASAQSLLKSDVIALPAEHIAAALLAARPSLRAEMGAKSRPAHPLRTLLGQVELRDAISDLLTVLRAANPARPLVLVLPSPRRWLTLTHQDAFGGSLDSTRANSESCVDTASIYVADFLRTFADSKLDAVALQETPGLGPSDHREFMSYAPILNKAQHYRWEFGLFDEGDADSCPSTGEDVHFQVRKVFPAGAQGRRIVTARLDSDASFLEHPVDQIRYCQIPADAHPEFVLRRLDQMRLGR